MVKKTHYQLDTMANVLQINGKSTVLYANLYNLLTVTRRGPHVEQELNPSGAPGFAPSV